MGRATVSARPWVGAIARSRALFCAVVLAAAARPAEARRLSQTPSAEPIEEACLCTTNGYSGGVQTGRAGCFFDPQGVALCYVASPSNCTSVAMQDSESFAAARVRACPEDQMPIANEMDIFATATGGGNDTSSSIAYSPITSFPPPDDAAVGLTPSLAPESERRVEAGPASPASSPSPRTLPSFVVDDPYPSSSPSPSPSSSPSPFPSPSASPSASPALGSNAILADNAANASNASYVGYPVPLTLEGGALLIDAIKESLAVDGAFVVYEPRGFVDLYLHPALQQAGRDLGASLGLTVTTSSNSLFGSETVVAKPFYAFGSG